MTRSALLLSALAFVCLPAAWAQEEGASPDGRTEVVEDPAQMSLLRRAKDTLESDASARRTLADRLMTSTLAERFTASDDPAKALAEVEDWVRKNPDDAASLAVGFAQDDADGTREFEASLHERVKRHIALAPGRYKGILGNLSAAGKESKKILKPDQLQDEEQRERLKRLFEGKGGEGSRVLHGPPEGPASYPGGGFYDRLSASNLSGYSPQVLALQSALNQGRPPGAPKVPETGRLDHDTLAQPAFGLRYELGRREAELAAHRAWALARLLGRDKELTPDTLRDPATLKALETEARGRSPGPRFDRRRRMLDRATAALRAFEALAETARDPRRVGRALLRELGDKQREASRWIAAASIEADLEKLAGEDSFPSPELKALVDSVALPSKTREAYWAQALRVRARLDGVKGNDERALALLEGADYAAHAAEVDRILASSNGPRRDLGRDIALVSRIPYPLKRLSLVKPFWRNWLDALMLRFFPRSRYSSQLAFDQANAAALQAAFEDVAVGDMRGAAQAYGAYAPPKP